MISELWAWLRRDRRSSRDSILGFHPAVDVLLVFVEGDTLDAERKVEMTGFEVIKGDEGREEEENPWQRFAQRPTEHKRKPIG